jgi:hypothetical protein
VGINGCLLPKALVGCQITKLLTIQVMLPQRVTAGVLRIFCPPEGKELFAPSYDNDDMP